MISRTATAAALLAILVVIAPRLMGGFAGAPTVSAEPLSQAAIQTDRTGANLLSAMAGVGKPIGSTVTDPLDAAPTASHDSDESARADSQADEYRRAIPRNGLSLADLVMGSPLDASRFFRNRNLNPRDSMVSKPDREKWTEYCARVSGPMTSLNARLGEAVIAEFSQQIDARRLRSVDLQGQRRRLSEDQKKLMERMEDQCARAIAARRGVDVSVVKDDKQFTTIVPELIFGGRTPLAFSAVGGAAYYADAADLPISLPLVRARNAAFVEVAYAAVGFFVSVGCLRPEEADAQLGSAVDAIYARYPEK